MTVPFAQKPEYTPAYKARVVAAYQSGTYSISALARTYGIARETARDWVRDANVPLRPRGRPGTPWTPELLANVRRLLAARRGRDAICAELRISWRTLAALKQHLANDVVVVKRRCELCLAVYPMNQDCPNGHGRVA